MFERSDYTLLNLLGDIGALYSTLSGIVSFILNLIGSDVVMENHLLNEVFTERAPDHVQPPIPLRVTYFDWLK